VIYRLLGKLEISRDDQSLDLPGGHNLIVLAALLINANQRMSKAELLQAAWGSKEVNEAQLHKSAAALRALLGQIGHDGDLVTHARHGYEIQVSDDDLDMQVFRRGLRQADEARSHGRVDDEITHLRRALGLSSPSESGLQRGEDQPCVAWLATIARVSSNQTSMALSIGGSIAPFQAVMVASRAAELSAMKPSRWI